MERLPLKRLCGGALVRAALMATPKDMLRPLFVEPEDIGHIGLGALELL
jgi:hypothetical protein